MESYIVTHIEPVRLVVDGKDIVVKNGDIVTLNPQIKKNAGAISRFLIMPVDKIKRSRQVE
jgi:hypothetical protein